MKAKVDNDTCTGCELCVDTCPAVFQMSDDVAKVVVDEIPEEEADSAQEAADSCPVEAITIEP